MDQLMTADEVADKLEVTKRTIYKWKATGALPYARLGRCLRFSPKDVEKFIEANSTQGTFRVRKEV